MKKRKIENCQPGQLKLFKFFHKVDGSDKTESTKGGEAVKKKFGDSSCSLNDVVEEKWSMYINGKSSSVPAKIKIISPEKSDISSKDKLDVSDCGSEDILPPTPRIHQNKWIESKRVFQKAKVNFSLKNSNTAEENDDISSDGSKSSVSKAFSVKEVVNKDNIHGSKHENYSESPSLQSSSDLDCKENGCIDKKVVSKINISCENSSEAPEKLHCQFSSCVSDFEKFQDVNEGTILNQCSKSEISICIAEKSKDVVDEYMDELLEDWDYTSNDQILDSELQKLQLDSIQRCKVISVSRGSGNDSTILELSSTTSNQMAKCELRGAWAFSSKVQPGDLINIRCDSKSDGLWILGDETQKLSAEMGILIEYPDTLIAGTSVVGSLFCPRKSVLADRFRGYEASSPPPSLLNDPNISNNIPSADKKPQNSARIMLIGCIVHELLQRSLQASLHSVEDISKAAYEILHSHKTAADMYAAQVELKDIEKDTMNFVASISNFMDYFVIGSKSAESRCLWGKGENKHDEREWRGSICEVKDIEENLWVPSLGLKGKIDVTVQVNIHPKRGKGKLNFSNSKEVPLELKTGRSTYSPEHQGQVILYCIMMSAVAAESGLDRSPIESGLLLYLREESMREINAGRREMRDLLLLRNELAYFLSRGPVIHDKEELEKLINQKKSKTDHVNIKLPISLPELPEAINHRRACSNCPYLTLCTAHLKCNNTLDSMSNSHPMSLLAPQALKHLKPAHLDYFVHWSNLVCLESKECLQDSKTHLLWTLGALEREKQGICLSHLIVKDVKYISGIEKELGRNVFLEGHLHTLMRDENFIHPSASVDPTSLDGLTSSKLQTLAFNVGDWVLISSDKRTTLSSGSLVSLTQDKICICLDRDITSRYGKGPFHVDKYEGYNSFGFCLTSMALLLEDNWSAARLRELIIDRREPQFMRKLDGRVIVKCSSILKKLNHCQKRAVLRALSAVDYLLIRGLPGTGKTATIVSMIQVFVALGKSVLLTGHSHSSVDNVMLRLVDQGLGHALLRLGRSGTQIHENIKPYMESVLTEDCCSPEDIEKVYYSKMIVGVTCMGSGHPLLCSRAFDVCILDEAGQILLPVSLRPIMSAKTFVLVGDPQQLPPVVRGHRARALGFEETLFNSLDSPETSLTLELQYRMNSVITKLANDMSYGSSLICADDTVANSTVNIPKYNDLINQYNEDKWLQASISSKLNNSLVFIDTGNTYNLVKEGLINKLIEKNNFLFKSDVCKYTNFIEAALVKYIVKAFTVGGVMQCKIGVMAPYKDQVLLLKNIFQTESKTATIEINTVDQFQGRDKEIIFYSFTRSGDASMKNSKSKELELLSNKHRLTVAVTRAKVKLICIGHMDTLKTYSILNDFMSFIPENNKISLHDGDDGFSWSKIFSSFNE